jgi:hypothetical protein
MTTYVAYYRVSTDRQGASGLGLDAQREAVARFVGAGTCLRNLPRLNPVRSTPTARSLRPHSPRVRSRAQRW